jgi:WD40 repeat protein
MPSRLFFKHVLISVCFLSLSLSACLSRQAGAVSTDPLASPAESLSPSPTGTIEVVFVKDGIVQVWDEATRQAQTIVDTGDVFSVTTSDDGEIIAFTRGSWVGDEFDGTEQFSLWAVNRDGGNLRELVSVQDLRQRIHPDDRESSNFYQMSWIPGSHRLIFSGTQYIVQAEGLSHAIPHGVYLVDTDQGSVTVLSEAAENLHFLPSPDGKQIALMSPSNMGFINADGSNRRQDILTYAEAGLTGPLFPVGVWTQDSRAFIMTGSFERLPEQNINFEIWRVPMDGSSPVSMAAVTDSIPSSVTFAPDGNSAAFFEAIQQDSEPLSWSTVPLSPEAGPLALPFYGKERSYANLHWSPAGDAYAIKDQDLLLLCPNAAQDSQVCGSPIHLTCSGIITSLRWVDATRFIFESIEPYALSLGNIDGTIIPITTWAEGQRWTENDVLSGWSFYASD